MIKVSFTFLVNGLVLDS